jgi:hypothetical protein
MVEVKDGIEEETGNETSENDFEAIFPSSQY